MIVDKVTHQAQVVVEVVVVQLQQDEDKFFNTARSLTASQREAVKNFYNTKYGDLKDWITGDFSFGEEDEALKLFNL